MTEACVLTTNNHPASIFSEIHSSKEKHFTSINDVAFAALERGAALFGKATFAMTYFSRWRIEEYFRYYRLAKGISPKVRLRWVKAPDGAY